MRWLAELTLPEIERMELDMLLAQYSLYAPQIDRTEAAIHERARRVERVPLLRTVGRMGDYTALAISSHIGPIERFRRPKSLTNFYGITPGSRSSGEKERLGHITKAGHPLVRFLLGQQVLHALRNDPGLRRWYQRIKRRRGAKIARVAVMRRLCEATWHVLSKKEPYRPVGSNRPAEQDTAPGRVRRATRSFRMAPDRVTA
jgi:transposase